MQKLLLVDDDDSFISIFSRYFTAGSYDVRVARTVEEALAVWAKSKPELAVVRVRLVEEAMSRVSGALLRQAGLADVPVIATGTWSERELLEGAKSWACDSFSRPCHPEKVWDIIRARIGFMPAPQVSVDLQRFAVPLSARPRPLEWSDEVLQDIVYLMYEASGNLVKTRERLSNQIEKRMRDLEIDKLTEYDRRLRTDARELANLVDLVTVNETFFFRSPDQFGGLRDTILPALTSGRADRRLKVWSAACSVGAEPYSLAMFFKDNIPGWRVEITASDIDGRALEAARSASFADYMVSRTPPEYKYLFERYARRNGDDKWHIAPDVRRMVEFKQENILDARHTGFDLVFCRNVMIYFDKQNVERMVEVLSRALKSGGILAVGDSEYLACEAQDLERVRPSRSTFFRKRHAREVAEQRRR